MTAELKPNPSAAPAGKKTALKSTDAESGFGLVVTGLALMGISFYYQFSTTLKRQIGTDNYWITMVFGGGGLLLTGFAWYRSARRRRYGVPVFVMDGDSGLLGDGLTGHIKVDRNLGTGIPLSLRLACHRQYMDNRESPVFEELWHAEVSEPTPSPGPGGMNSVPVSFALPADAHPTHRTDVNNFVYWRLTAKAKQPGIDFRAVFEVPVRRR